VSVLFSSEGFKFGERFATLSISVCSLVDQFLIAPSGTLRSLDGFWVCSQQKEVYHASLI
jgi:hypothetical protein